MSFDIITNGVLVVIYLPNTSPVVGGGSIKKETLFTLQNLHDNGNGRVYRELTNNDVVFGRGGKANHHLGNVRYRNEIQRFEKCYKSAVTRSEKEWIVDTFVQCLQSDGTTINFLEKESKGKGNTTNCNCWFVVDDDIIRRKVHQALRENRDPKKRKAKRQRFLAKKAKAAAAAVAEVAAVAVAAAAAAKYKTKKGEKINKLDRYI